MLFSPFWDSFVSAVDENKALSDVDKFNYLKTLVEGTAAAAIRGLPLTADNYEAVKNILKKRFGQPQVIINAHMEGLVMIAAVASDSNLKRLRELYDQVEAHIRALQALGVESESYGKLLIPLLMEKLPANLRLIISRSIDKEEWDLDVLLRAFDNEIEARERCELIGNNLSEPAVTPVKSNVGRFIRELKQQTFLRSRTSGTSRGPGSSTALLAPQLKVKQPTSTQGRLLLVAAVKSINKRCLR